MPPLCTATRFLRRSCQKPENRFVHGKPRSVGSPPLPHFPLWVARAMPTPRNLVRACLALAVLVGTTGASVGTASAGPIEDKRAEAAHIAAQLDAGASQVTQLSKQADRAKGELGATDTALAQATAEANAADAHLHATRPRLAA